MLVLQQKVRIKNYKKFIILVENHGLKNMYSQIPNSGALLCWMMEWVKICSM